MSAFDLESLNRALRGTAFAGRIHLYESVESTNQIAIEAGAAGAPHGSVYVAEEQTAGRGRGGHGWHSAAGSGLYVSVLLRPSTPPTEILWLSLAAGLAVRDSIEAVTGLKADLRWPNDLLFGSRKFCGILTEMQSDMLHVHTAVIGIGINVTQESFPPELVATATSLRIESGRSWPRQEILLALLQSLHRETAALESPEGVRDASASIPQRLEAASTWIRGKQVLVGDPEEFRGVTAGLDARGFLQVETAQGIRTVYSGGVRETKNLRQQKISSTKG
jgi:BirA family biotin operon repressor/biotin-[acetyl-CoA-carboxylase] ligase